MPEAPQLAELIGAARSPGEFVAGAGLPLAMAEIGLVVDRREDLRAAACRIGAVEAQLRGELLCGLRLRAWLDPGGLHRRRLRHHYACLLSAVVSRALGDSGGAARAVERVRELDELIAADAFAVPRRWPLIAAQVACWAVNPCFWAGAVYSQVMADHYGSLVVAARSLLQR